jgi:hypothetical protein
VRFPYRPYEVAAPRGQTGTVTVYRPTIPVRIIGPTDQRVVVALLDTGADQTVLPASIRERVGVDVDPVATVQFRGVGGELLTATYGTVAIEISDGAERARWSAPVAFLEGTSLILLGHAGFLEYFVATFDGKHRHVTLTPNDTLPAVASP